MKSAWDVYGQEGDVQWGYVLGRFFYDNFFNILLIIVMLNIVAGIIIDTFGSLREELGNYTNDLENFCFICGFDKETIEKESANLKGFNFHIKQEHYQWNYLFYIAYILEKDNTEYTGIESYVADKLENNEITWFPINRQIHFSLLFSLKSTLPPQEP